MNKFILCIGIPLIWWIGSLEGQMCCLYNVKQSPYATYIAQKTGDILTIIVNEEAQTQDDGNKTLKKTNALKASLNKFFIPGWKVNKGFTTVAGSGTPPGIDFSSSSDFEGEAKNSSKHSFETKIQVRMIEQVRDGEFVIRGQHNVNINGKKKKIFISGVIRQRDIAADNTIKSHQIAEATIEIDGEVAQKDLQPALFTRLFNLIF